MAHTKMLIELSKRIHGKLHKSPTFLYLPPSKTEGLLIYPESGIHLHHVARYCYHQWQLPVLGCTALGNDYELLPSIVRQFCYH